VIADRPLYAGDIAVAGSPMLVVMDVSRVVARVNVPTADAAGVKVGQAATVTVADTAQELQGKVTVASPATDLNSATVQVWVQVDNPGHTLKAGTAVHVSIVTEIIKNAMLVPVAAILPGETGGTAVLREDVVVVGGMGVDDKAKVKVVDATAPDADEDQPEEAAPAKDAKKKDEAKPKQK
jgi:HlyD family secretion protein